MEEHRKEFQAAMLELMNDLANKIPNPKPVTITLKTTPFRDFDTAEDFIDEIYEEIYNYVDYDMREMGL